MHGCAGQAGRTPGWVAEPRRHRALAIRSSDTTPVRLRIVRDGTVTASSEPFTPAGGDSIETIPARLPISGGQQLGLDHDGTQALHELSPASGAVLQEFEPALPDPPGMGGSVRQDVEDVELLVNADVEPDGDRDGYGDETQDACPLDRTTAGLCPTRLRVSLRNDSLVNDSVFNPFALVGSDVDVRVRVEKEIKRVPNLRLDVAVPVGTAQLLSARIDGAGACATGLPLSCSFGDIAPEPPVPDVSVKLRPTVAGPLTVVATVKSDAPDPDPNDDRSVLNLTVLATGACTNTSAGTAGADTLKGTPYGDRILGKAGDDVLRGASGADCLLGGGGADAIAGGPGGDQLDGGPGADRLRGEAGADTLRGGRGVDRFDGGAGNDRLDSRDGKREVVRCGAGHDRVRADRRDRLIACEHKRVRRS